MKKKILSLSGGLDSTILAYKLVKEFGAENVIALTFNYGQRHSIEVEKSKITCQKLNIEHKIIDISFLGDLVKNTCSLIQDSNIAVPHIREVLGHPQPSTEVPYRNMIFTSLCLSCAQANDADEVYLSIQQHDLYFYWDCSAQFVEGINRISQLNRKYQIQLCTPFVDLSKAEEIKIGQELNVPFEDTLTCYQGNVDENGETISCGVCGSCSERIANFAKAQIKDPVKYAKEIDWGYLFELKK
jgi:7-cyano-7-deazaguanine synthase